MDATTIFVLGLVAAAVLAAAGVFVVAARRGPAAGPITGDFDRRAAHKDRQARSVREQGGAVATIVKEDEATDEEAETQVAEPVDDPLLERVEISAADYGVTRRQFLNRSLLGLFGGAFLGGLSLGFLAFLWPKLGGGFGTAIAVGNFEELRAEVGTTTLTPRFVAAAQTWLVPFDPGELEGSSFEGMPVVAGGGGGEMGLMALWQRCVHLGCRVPACVPSQGFECPCHGSRYNFHGEYEAGPAPRNLDRFEVEIDEAGMLIVNTGAIFETPRAKNKTISYPQGPSCI